MLVVRFCGGLGNQMYQYAFCIKLKSLFPECAIKIDLSEYYTCRYHHGYEIDFIFSKDLEFPRIGWWDLKELKGELPALPFIYMGKISREMERLRKRINERWFSTNQKQILDESQIDVFHMKEYFELEFENRDYYFEGYWSQINYYVDQLEKLKKTFNFKEFTEEKNIIIAEKIRTTQSVGVHIRRGDYIGTEMDILTLEYYIEAIQYMNHRVENAVFYFFSDDVKYIEESFGFLKNKSIIWWNQGNKSYRDLQLMTYCKHNIIANSSFSQWGALLNQNHHHIVLYPSKKCVGTEMEQVLLSNWYRIEV